MTSRRSSPSSKHLVAYSVFLLTGVGPVAGQSVNGTVWDSLTNQPVGSGFVVLLDIDGREVVRALASAAGTFRIMAPTSGTYTLRSERIGFRATQSTPFNLPQSGVHKVDLYTTSLPTMLEAMEINTQPKCNVRSDNQSTLLIAWEEVRKALSASVWDGNEGVRYRRYSYTRELPANRRRIDREEGDVVDAIAQQPYESRPTQELLTLGYVIQSDEGIQYSIPDAQTLLHDSFLERHCFSVVSGGGNNQHHVGLRFEPATRQRGVSQVQGTLWLRQDTWELTRLDVQYTALPGAVEDDRAGGTVHYLQLPSGAWIINQWELRTPIIQLVAPDARVFNRGTDPVPTIVGFTDHGGTVLEIDVGANEKLYPARLAHVVGTVFDSVTQAPLANARVQLDDTGFWAATDTTGAYHLTAPLQGTYDLTVSFDALAALAQRFTYPVALNIDSTSTLHIPVPPLGNLMANACPQPDSTPSAMIVGTVLNKRQLVRNATVMASWQQTQTIDGRAVTSDVEHTIVTDASGYYTLCGVPQGQEVQLRATHDGLTSPTGHLLYAGPAMNRLLFGWNRTPHTPYPRRYSNDLGVWKIDLALGAEAPTVPTTSESIVTGFVTDQSTGLPVPGVKVIVNGTDSTLTRDDGTFTVDYASIGTNTIVALRGIGYTPWIGAYGHDEGSQRLDIGAAIQSRAFTLAPIDVTADAAERLLTSVGFYQRQKTNFGHFMDPEDVVERSGVAHNLGDLFRHFPDVAVYHNSDQLGVTVALGGLRNTCPNPRVLVDGMVIEPGGTGFTQKERETPLPLHVLSTGLLHPDDILAVEIYSTPSAVPIEFGGVRSKCGVIVIWTHRGR